MLDGKWRLNNITKIPFFHYTNTILIKHINKKRFLIKDEIFILLHIDDGVLPVVSGEDTILGTNIVFEIMARLGLNMHVGTKNKASKTEAVSFPSKTKIISWLKDHDEKLLPSPEDSTKMSDPSKK